MKTVSVILATYNSEKYIERALNSLLSQRGLHEHFELEIIVVDDCSQDNTLKILSKYEIVYLKNRHNSGGPNKGRNKGLRIAKGDFICIMDHDDEWLPDKIITQLKYSDLAPIITCGYYVIQKDKATLSRFNTPSDQRDYSFYEKNVTFRDVVSKTKNRQITYVGSIMFHKSLKNTFFEESFGQIDFDWITRLFQNVTSVEVCKALYNRYVHEVNLSLNEEYRRRDYFFSLYTLDQFEDDFPNEVRRGIRRVNGTMGRYYYLMDKMPKARRYFLKSSINLKTGLFILTSFWGHKLVKKKFHFFG